PEAERMIKSGSEWRSSKDGGYSIELRFSNRDKLIVNNPRLARLFNPKLFPNTSVAGKVLQLVSKLDENEKIAGIHYLNDRPRKEWVAIALLDIAPRDAEVETDKIVIRQGDDRMVITYPEIGEIVKFEGMSFRVEKRARGKAIVEFRSLETMPDAQPESEPTPQPEPQPAEPQAPVAQDAPEPQPEPAPAVETAPASQNSMIEIPTMGDLEKLNLEELEQLGETVEQYAAAIVDLIAARAANRATSNS
ncbi:hypothetical protein ACFL2D_02470, partial [Patescibacteria group bacterium]